MGNKITIKDIAKECNISIGTVDRILHHRGRVSDETAARVNEAIHKLGYIPKSAPGPACITTPTFRIGINYPLDESEGSFWHDVSVGIQQVEPVLKSMGVEIIKNCTSDFSADLQHQAIVDLVNQNVDALITTAFDITSDYVFSEIIPAAIPFATVINKSWGGRSLFHIGPNDEASGASIAKLISLYCGSTPNVVILAPSIEIEGTNRRISGFVTKAQKELTDINIQQIKPILTETVENSYCIVYSETESILQANEEIDAIYITNGFVKPVCDAVIRHNRQAQIKVFGHEAFAGMRDYFENGCLAATVYQNAKQQWYDALLTMSNYLINNIVPASWMIASCCVLTKETLPMAGFHLRTYSQIVGNSSKVSNTL